MHSLFNVERFLNKNENETKMLELDGKNTETDISPQKRVLDEKKIILENDLYENKNLINLAKIKTLGSNLVVKAQETSTETFQNMLNLADEINAGEEKFLSKNLRDFILRYMLGYVVVLLLMLLLIKTNSLSIKNASILSIFIGIILTGFLGYYYFL